MHIISTKLCPGVRQLVGLSKLVLDELFTFLQVVLKIHIKFVDLIEMISGDAYFVCMRIIITSNNNNIYL